MSTEHPILFSGPLVRAILAGQKTQTRRLLRWDGVQRVEPCPVGPAGNWSLTSYGGSLRVVRCPFGVPGDRLWVREAWMTVGWAPERRWQLAYQASMQARPTELIEAPEGWREPLANIQRKWVPGIHMPRWASRISLENVEVRVQRIQEITEEDARAEGLPRNWTDGQPGWSPEEHGYLTPAGLYADDHGDDSPECWAYWKGKRQVGCVYTAREAIRIWWGHINGADSWDRNPWVWAVSFKRVQP